jgi:ATP-dependent DNA ligase
MTEGPDYLAAALHFFGRARRFLNDSERARFFAVARRYQTLANRGSRHPRRSCRAPPLARALRSVSRSATDWRPRPLEERKARLAKLLAKAPVGIHYTEHLEGDGAVA